MHSSISNSDSSKANHWGKTWLLTVVALLLFFICYESFLKRTGHQTSIASDENLWSYYRERARNNSDALVILGASRAQLGLHGATLKAAMPEKDIFQLTINGQYPMATLSSLAEDESFVGTVWVSMVAQSLEPVYWEMQVDHNRYYDEQATWDKNTHAFGAAWMQSRWRFLHPELHGKNLISQWIEQGSFPAPFYVRELLDRSKSGDYSEQDKAALVKHFVEQKAQNYHDQPPMPLSVWYQQLERLFDMCKKISDRGGRVLLLRMPTDKGHWILDETYYPKAEYWDVMAENSNIQTIHFKNHGSLSNFDLPDSSHLDVSDAPKFTESLLSVLDEL